MRGKGWLNSCEQDGVLVSFYYEKGIKDICEGMVIFVTIINLADSDGCLWLGKELAFGSGGDAGDDYLGNRSGGEKWRKDKNKFLGKFIRINVGSDSGILV